METDQQLVPSVVSVMVVHEPGEWFAETLQSLVSQDYPNLRTLFLVTPGDEPDSASEQILSALPEAFIRHLPSNEGFGAAVNHVLELVEGDNGFFLPCHDDVALAPNAVSALVTELFRSNAGLVGPKLVEWDSPRTLQHVGLGLDRFGEVDPIVEPDEVDQEQHDAVRDVFVLPSACLLVRADLFRSVGGFDPAISFHGDDVDLCWRAHLTGARVIVAPDARVRHRERLVERRPDLNHRALRSRHRMRAMATLTSGSRLLGRSIQLVLLTVVELIVGLFTGRAGEALSSLRSLVGLIPRTGSIIARRRAIRAQRAVPEREILHLLDRGSSRLNSFLRGRQTTTYVGEDSTIRRWRERSFGPVLAWFLVLLAIVIGSRSFIRDGVPEVGEFLPFPDSPRALWADYRSSWDPRGFGATGAVPTGWAVLAASSVLSLFRMSLLMTMSVVGLYVLGAAGAWRLSTVFPSSRARIAGMAVYVGTPLVPGALSLGNWSAIAWYAALPWLVHVLARSAGLATADPGAASVDLTDGVEPVSMRQRVRSLAFGVLVLAACAAFVPAALVLFVAVGAMLAFATLLAGGSWRVSAWLGGGAAGIAAGAALLNLPWLLQWDRDVLTGPPLAGSTGRGLVEVVSLAVSTDRFAVLAVALYVPVLAALAITRAWRLTWSVRAAALVVGFAALAIFAERGSLGVAVPAPSLLLVPVALGLSLGAASIAGAFGSDVLSRGFGWRQPVALLANVAIVIGVIPAALSIGHGAWHTPNTPVARLLSSQLREDPADGEFRVLYLGDPRVMPVPGRHYRDGIAFAVTDAGELDFRDRFPTLDTAGDDAVAEALDLIAGRSTLRVGRLLAPLGVRYIVIPTVDGAASTVDDPIPLPEGLLGALQTQLDLGTVFGPPTLEIFENQSWMPVGAQLVGDSAEASRLAGADSLVRSDLGDAVPSMRGIDGGAAAVNQVAPGAVHLAIPFDDRFVLSVDGNDVAARPSFGVATAFDVDQGGAGAIRYERAGSRPAWLVFQFVLWGVALFAALGTGSRLRRRRFDEAYDETIIDLSDAPPLSAGVAGEALGLPIELTDGDIADTDPTVADGVDGADGADRETPAAIGDEEPQ